MYKIIRDFGAKIKKDGRSGYYIYVGVNFELKFNTEYCVSSKPLWVVNEYEADWKKVKGMDIETIHHTKRDLVWELYNNDLSINEELDMEKSIEMTTQEVDEFNSWVDSDNVVEVKGGYQTQCTQYQHTFGHSELVEYYTKEYITPTR